MCVYLSNGDLGESVDNANTDEGYTHIQLLQLGRLVQCWKGEKKCLVPSIRMHVFIGFHCRDSSQRW
uniref:Uncharacterized protein n=2 Tax=Oryza sativa subsp. japonica TaxID=39947 RepID=Q6ZCL4_ORYSJ|nr:hypothetical protein [Oryza sativa Japonica Group]BAD10423.1 hypothetical protein [Oryza sativa Japonica Group]